MRRSTHHLHAEFVVSGPLVRDWTTSLAVDPPPPLPPPAKAPHPEGPVPQVEEESARVARLSLQDLEGLAKELIEDDWDLDEALWVLAEACRAAPELQHKAGLYRHGGVVGVLGGTTDKPLLTELTSTVA